MIQSLSISGLITMEMHALNNEGSEGNTMMTRMVDIVDQQGVKHTVNAVSGDMFKHILMEHLQQEAKRSGLPLCAGCEIFNANRICYDETFTKSFAKGTVDSDVLAGALQKCTLDDVGGVLITNEIGEKKRSIARKSCVEFGWVVGRPEATVTESYFHAKYVPEGRGKGSGAGENLGQNIFHRPASSGQYAVVLNVDLYKVGRNDITLEYAIDEGARTTRKKALLSSVLNTFLKPTGAHRNTQHPHIVQFEGLITTSASTVPAPLMSALNPDYLDQLKRITDSLNKVYPGTIANHAFTSLGAFAEQLTALI